MIKRATVFFLPKVLLLTIVLAIVALSPVFVQSAFAERVEGPLRADPKAYEHIDDEALSVQSLDDMFDGEVTAQATGTSNFVSLNLTLDKMVQMCMKNDIYNFSYGEFQAALDPNSNTLAQNFAVFADLRTSSGLTAAQIDSFIESTAKGREGKLRGMGSAFLRAEATYHVNAAYLVAHAILETGWGTSALANGSLGIYNFYGIGAYDGDPENAGMELAGRYGWTTPEGAVLGGASWIAKHYIYASEYAQPTLYAMKWDYARANAKGECWHQYCTGVSWHTQIADIMNRGYAYAGVEPVYNYVIPEYQGSSGPDTNVRAMYRLYNPNSGEHFYTASVGERSDLVYAGWHYEGIAWKAPKTSGAPVYRLYSGTDHHYTLDSKERDWLVTQGWKYEGVGWYSDEAKGTVLYRLFNPNVQPTAPCNNSGSHHYTTDASERDRLVSVGWIYEGNCWHGLK